MTHASEGSGVIPCTGESVGSAQELGSSEDDRDITDLGAPNEGAVGALLDGSVKTQVSRQRQAEWIRSRASELGNQLCCESRPSADKYLPSVRC